MEDKFGRLTNEKYFFANSDNFLKTKVSKKFREFVAKVEETLISYESYLEKPHNYLFYGGNRIGKTWLLHFIMNRLIKVGSTDVYYVTVDELMRAHREMDFKHDEYLWVTFYASVESLFIDDLGSEHRTDSGFVKRKLEKFLRYRLGSHGKHTYVAMASDELSFVTNTYGADINSIFESEFLEYDLGDKKIVLVNKDEVDAFN